jgi:hypothetical protein
MQNEELKMKNARFASLIFHFAFPVVAEASSGRSLRLSG